MSIPEVNSRLFTNKQVIKPRKPKEHRLDLGTESYRSNPGPGSYEIFSSPLYDTPKITIKEKIPIKVEDPTQNVEFYCPPPMKPQKKTIGSRGSLSYFDEVDTPFYAPVLPSTLSQSRYTKILERHPQKDPNMDIPGPGQYTPIHVSKRIKTSFGSSRPKDTLFGQADNGVPGPGKYNITKSYPKPTNWTEFLRNTKPVQPVHYLKRQPPGSIRKTSFRPIQL